MKDGDASLIDEKELIHTLKVDISMYNSDGIIYPSAYQKLTMNMIEEHLDMLNMGQKALMADQGVSWVLLYNCIEFVRKITPEDKLTARTWHSECKAPIFRRDFAFYGENGEKTAVGATLSTLFDYKIRRVCTDLKSYSRIALPEGIKLLDIERRFVPPKETEIADRCLARPSMTDGIGHVNNTRYSDFVYDAMTRDERARLSDLCRMDSWFFSELRAGDEFEIRRSPEKENTSVWLGIKAGDIKPCFAVRFRYKNQEKDNETVGPTTECEGIDNENQ